MMRKMIVNKKRHEKRTPAVKLVLAPSVEKILSNHGPNGEAASNATAGRVRLQIKGSENDVINRRPAGKQRVALLGVCAKGMGPLIASFEI